MAIKNILTNILNMKIKSRLTNLFFTLDAKLYSNPFKYTFIINTIIFVILFMILNINNTVILCDSLDDDYYPKDQASDPDRVVTKFEQGKEQLSLQEIADMLTDTISVKSIDEKIAISDSAIEFLGPKDQLTEGDFDKMVANIYFDDTNGRRETDHTSSILGKITDQVMFEVEQFEKNNNSDNNENNNTSSASSASSSSSSSSSSSASCDAPRPWGIYFQNSATPQMEAIEELHDNILFYLSIILFIVGWMLMLIYIKFSKLQLSIPSIHINHGKLVELLWTIAPAVILILIAFPSFKLLYLMDEVIDPLIAVLAEGHQWYWSYQYPDFLNSDNDFIEFDSYLIPESDLEEGELRMLEVDNRVVIPELTHIRFIVTAADVIHSYACPSLGIKCDAYPGRLSQASVFINREGTFYGQCSEICGILHSSMPIVIESVSFEKFLAWLTQK